MEVNKVWAVPVSLATTPRIVVYFLFLGVLRCFSSPGYRYLILYIQMSAMRHNSHEVSPFGHPRFKACRQLPVAYRSQLRPSSVSYVKASLVRA